MEGGGRWGYSPPPMSELSLPERLRRRLRRSVIAPLDARVGGAIRRRRNAQRVFRPVFVTGAMGSGTTLMALSLGQRFDFASVVTESAHQVAEDSFLHNPGVEAFATVRDYQASIEPQMDWSVERGREDLLDLYRAYARGPSDRAIDKGPNTNVLRADFLARCFPEAFFVCVFRDPVANVEGFRRKWPTFGRDRFEESIRFWAELHERFLEHAETLGERAFVVEYEHFVARHDEVLSVLGRRMGLDPARERRRLPHRDNVEGRGIRNVSRSRIGVLEDENRKAYERLAAPDVAAVREALEPLRARLRERALEA